MTRAYHPYDRRAMAAYRARKQAKGLCAWGGCNEPHSGTAYCTTHRQRVNASSNSLYYARRRGIDATAGRG